MHGPATASPCTMLLLGSALAALREPAPHVREHAAGENHQAGRGARPLLARGAADVGANTLAGVPLHDDHVSLLVLIHRPILSEERP